MFLVYSSLRSMCSKIESVCTFTYLLVGAAIFDALESAHEETERADFIELIKKWQETYGITNEDMEQMMHDIPRMKSYYAGTQWKFAGAFYFSTTVITTIGYGHSTPKTVPGKVFCMVYALPGIPLCIVMFQSIGERMNAFLTFCLGKIKRCFRLPGSEISQTHVIAVSANLCIIVLIAGAAAFSFYESWSYINSFYYCFITLTTIGFGDFVALQRNNSLSQQPDYVVFSLVFILFGLAVISSAMNLLVLRFLTMNTEDERRDELEAAAAAHAPLRLEGDVILNVETASNISAISNSKATRIAGPLDWTLDKDSVCSCTDIKIVCNPWEHNTDCVCSGDGVNGVTSSTANLTLKPMRRRKHWRQRFVLWKHNSLCRGRRYTRTRLPGPVVHLAKPLSNEPSGSDNINYVRRHYSTWCKSFSVNMPSTHSSQPAAFRKRLSI